jgi:long-chain-fatty-acid--CoA ligase ACSBG
METMFEYLSYLLAKHLILNKIHAALGLGKAKLFASAAAPLSIDTWTYFASIGAPIFDIYGMSECTGPQVDAAVRWLVFFLFSSNAAVVDVQHHVRLRPGLCGAQSPRLRNRAEGARGPTLVSKSDVVMAVYVQHVPGRDAEGEGEVCFRGRHVMMGYLFDSEKTAEVIDEV